MTMNLAMQLAVLLCHARKLIFASILSSLGTTVIFWTAAIDHAGALDKPSMLSQLRARKARVVELIGSIDTRIQTTLANSVADAGLELNAPKNSFEGEIETLRKKRRDLIGERRFWDLVILQTDQHFTGGDAKAFLCDRLIKAAEIEVKQGPNEESLWRLMTYLAQALRASEEPEHSAITFLEDYLRFGSPFDPIRPEAVFKARHYVNRRESVMAQPVMRQDLGELVEERILNSTPNEAQTMPPSFSN